MDTQHSTARQLLLLVPSCCFLFRLPLALRVAATKFQTAIPPQSAPCARNQLTVFGSRVAEFLLLLLARSLADFHSTARLACWPAAASINPRRLVCSKLGPFLPLAARWLHGSSSQGSSFLPSNRILPQIPSLCAARSCSVRSGFVKTEAAD